MTSSLRVAGMGLVLMSALVLTGCIGPFKKVPAPEAPIKPVLEDISSPEKMLEGYNDLQKDALKAANQAIEKASESLNVPPPPPATNFSDLQAQAKEASRKAIQNALQQPGLTPTQKAELQNALNRLK